MPRRAALFALCLSPLLPAAASAQTTAQSASAVEQQIRDWITATLGPSAKIAPRPVELTPAGDHYNVAVPLGAAPSDPRLTAVARPGASGRWSVDDIRVPSPATFTVNMPMSGDAANGGGKLVYTVTIGQQSGQSQIDPSFATPTTTTSSMRNVDIQVSGGPGKQATHAERMDNAVLIQPTVNGRVDVKIDASAEGYRVDAAISELPAPLQIRFNKATVQGQMSGVSRDRAVQLTRAMVDLIAASQAAAATAEPGGPAKPPLSPEAATALLEAAADLASGMSLDETVQGLDVRMQDMEGGMQNLRFGFGVKGTGGLLDARLEVGAEKLTLPPQLGLGPMAELIPTKLTLRPTVSGLPADALIAMLKKSGDGGQPGPEDVGALFAHGPIVAGLDTLRLAVAGAEFSGLGKLTIASPDNVKGTAQITATGLDLLQQRIATEPSLAQAGPVLIFLKGIGRSVGNQMVWDISYDGSRLLVNNTDMMALMGGGGGGGDNAQRQNAPSSSTPTPTPPSNRKPLHAR